MDSSSPNATAPSPTPNWPATNWPATTWPTGHLRLPYYTKAPHARWQLWEQTESYFGRSKAVTCKRLRMFAKGKKWNAQIGANMPQWGTFKHLLLQVVVRNDLGEFLKIRMSCFHGLDFPSFTVVHETDIFHPHPTETGYTQWELERRLIPALGLELFEKVLDEFADRMALEMQKAEKKGGKKPKKKNKPKDVEEEEVEFGPLPRSFRQSLCYQKLKLLATTAGIEVGDNMQGLELARLEFKERYHKYMERKAHLMRLQQEFPHVVPDLGRAPNPPPEPKARVLFQVNKAVWAPERFLDEALKVDGGDWQVVDGKVMTIKRKKQERFLVSLTVKETEAEVEE